MDITKPEQDQRGRYRIEQTLGAGGMGIVHLAEDTHLHRRVAIKKLRPDTAGSSAQRRIQREARLLAQLNHPNIVRLYDVLEEEDGGVALVMEYVEGTTLREWMRGHGISLENKLGILVQICKGLEQAHQLGIIHRDLKADNILISHDSAAVTAKITDFGIAKSWREDSDLTRDQHIAGSWGVMSPEQVQGEPLDNRSDLFTLGILAYRLLCGQNPFGDCDSAYAIAKRIVHHPHPPAARLNPQLPDALSKLLDRLMAKDPEHRPGSAGEVAAALGDIIAALGDNRPEQRTDSEPDIAITTESFYRKNRRGTAARTAVLTAIAIAVLATTTLFYLSGTPQEKSGEYIAVALPEAARESRPQARMLHNNVLNAIRDGLSNRQGLYLVPLSESRALRGKPLRQMADTLNIQLLLNPEISCREKVCDLSLQLIDTQDLSTVASRSFDLDLDTYLAGYARTLQQINYLFPDYPLRQPRPELQISEADYQRYLELEALHYDEQQGAEILPALESLQRRAPYFAPIYELHSLCVFQARFYNVDLGAVERLEKLLARAPAKIADTPELISARLNLAETQHDWEEADRQLERLKMAITDKAGYYHRKALNYQLRGEYKKALEAAERALSLRTGSNYLMQKTIALSYLGDMEGARPILQQILKIDGENMDALSLLAANELDMGHPGETIRLLESVDSIQLPPLDNYNLCAAHYLQKNVREAAPCFRKLGERNPHDSEPLLFRAEMARAQGRPETARRLTERAIEKTSRREGWENRLILALAQAQLGEHQKAVETLIEIRRQAPDDTYVNHIRAQIYITTGDLPLAEAHVRRTLELGQSPLWYNTPRFARLCTDHSFEALRRDYPDLCAPAEKAPGTARK